MADKPVECSIPTHDWEEISNYTDIPKVFKDNEGKIDLQGDIFMSIFRCKRCRVLRFFSIE